MAVRRHARARDVILKATIEDRVILSSFGVRSASLLPSLLVAVAAVVPVEMMRREAAGFGVAVVVMIGDGGGSGENDLSGREDTRSPPPPEC